MSAGAAGRLHSQHLDRHLRLVNSCPSPKQLHLGLPMLRRLAASWSRLQLFVVRTRRRARPSAGLPCDEVADLAAAVEQLLARIDRLGTGNVDAVSRSALAASADAPAGGDRNDEAERPDARALSSRFIAACRSSVEVAAGLSRRALCSQHRCKPDFTASDGRDLDSRQAPTSSAD